ncbi:MAG: hypothetical protein ACKPA8_08210 [Dolichospermum sp.]
MPNYAPGQILVRLAQVVERKNHHCHCLKECLNVIVVVLNAVEM